MIVQATISATHLDSIESIEIFGLATFLFLYKKSNALCKKNYLLAEILHTKLYKIEHIQLKTYS